MSAPRPGALQGPPADLVGPVAVIIPRFPSVTGAALLREIDALERQGVPIVLVALEREEPSLVPEEAEAWIQRVWYLRFVGPRVLAANLRVIARHPRRWLGNLARLAWDARGDLARVAQVLGHYLGAVELGQRLRDAGVRHVHAHDAEAPALIARIASRVHRGPPLASSVTVHGHDIAASPAGLGTRLEGVSFLRCTSRHAQSSLRGALGAAMPDAPLVMIRQGVADAAKSARVPALGSPGLERPLRIACVARLDPHVGLDCLLEALRLLATGSGGLRRVAVHCTLIGDGRERGRLELRARSTGLEDAVAFLGARSQREVLHALRGADVFVLPSGADEPGRVEGLPAALIESLAAGTPTIAPRRAGISELVVDGETGLLVDPEDAHALAAALLRIVDDPAAAAERAGRGLELIRADFGLREAAARLAAEFARNGAALEAGAPDDVAELARECATLVVGPTPRIGLAGVTRLGSGLAVEMRLGAPEGRADGRSTRALGRRRTCDAKGSPVPETRALEALAASMALLDDGETHPSVPRSLGCDPARRLEVVSLEEGVDLTHLMRRGRWLSGDPDLAASLAGQWLGRFERIPLPKAESAATDRDAITARILHEAAEDAARCVEFGLSPTLVDRALQLCRRELRESLTRPPCWSHGSFVTGHVAVAGLDPLFLGVEGRVPRAEQAAHWRVTTREFGGLRPGVPGEDAAMFLESVAILVPGLASLGLLSSRRHELERAFLRGHDGVRPTEPTPALRAAKLLAIGATSHQLEETPRGFVERARRRSLRVRLAARIIELAI